MAWTYKVVRSQSQEGCHEETLNALNQLSAAQMASAKVGGTVTNENGPFQFVGVIFYDVTAQLPVPDASKLTNTWTQYGVALKDQTNTDIDVWQKVADFLNDPNNSLSNSQKFYATISLDHASDYQFYLMNNISIWYRQRNN